MSVLIYFGMMLVLIGVGTGVLALTFRQWYLDRKQTQKGDLPR